MSKKIFVKEVTPNGMTFHNPEGWDMYGEPYLVRTDHKHIDKLLSFLGKPVVVNYALVKPDIKWNHIPADWDRESFISVCVRINRLNGCQNGEGNSRGEIEIFPDHSGNWRSVDLRMVRLADEEDFEIEKEKYKEKTRSIDNGYERVIRD